MCYPSHKIEVIQLEKTKLLQRDRQIEKHLRNYKTYLVSIRNCQEQLNYLYPNITTSYSFDKQGGYFYIKTDKTANGAIDRIESKRALDLEEEIWRNSIITTSIENAFNDLSEEEQNFITWRYFNNHSIDEVRHKLGYAEAKSVFRIRRLVLDKLAISLHNLTTF